MLSFSTCDPCNNLISFYSGVHSQNGLYTFSPGIERYTTVITFNDTTQSELKELIIIIQNSSLVSFHMSIWSEYLSSLPSWRSCFQWSKQVIFSSIMGTWFFHSCYDFGSRNSPEKRCLINYSLNTAATCTYIYLTEMVVAAQLLIV